MKQEQAMDGLMTTEQVSRYFRVTETTIRRWVAQGRLRAVRVGNRVLRFEPSAIRDFLQVNYR